MIIPESRNQIARLQLVFALVAVLHLASAAWHIFFGGLNPDEGFYAVATRAVAQGEVPYRDFGFTQPPLVPYVNSLPMRFVGFGLFQQRLVNGIWIALALALAASLLARRTQPLWGLALAAAFSLSAPWMYFVHLGKTYAVTSLLVMIAAWIFLEMPPKPRRSFLLGFVAVLGTGARLPAAPYFGLLCLFSFWPTWQMAARKITAGMAGAALGATIVVLPFWIAARVGTSFWVFDFHRVSVPNKQWHLDWKEIATLAPALWLLIALMLTISWRRLTLGRRETGLFISSIAALAVNLLPGGVYEEYGTPFLLPLAVAGSALLSEQASKWSRRTGFLIFAALAIAQLMTAPILCRALLPRRSATASWWLTPNAPAYNLSLPAQLRNVRAVAEKWIGPGQSIAGPNIILATEIDRPIAANLRMGPFSATAEMSLEQANQFHLITSQQLTSVFADPNTGLLVFFNRALLNYAWSMPSFANIPLSERKPWVEIFHREYSIVYQEGDFLLLARTNRP